MGTTLTGLKRVSRGVVSYRGFLIVSFLGKQLYVRSTKYIRMYAVCTPWDADKRFKGHDPEDFSKGLDVGRLALRRRNYHDLKFVTGTAKPRPAYCVEETRKGAMGSVDRMLQEYGAVPDWEVDFPVYGDADLAWLKQHPEEVPLLLAQWPGSQQLKEIMEAS